MTERLVILLAPLWISGCVTVVNGEPGAGRILWKNRSTLNYMNESELFLYDTFPQSFMWGVGSSAFAIEGGWEKDGKGASVWDDLTHRESSRFDNTTADTASDSYTFLHKDLAALEHLGVNSYLFSISWPRLFPKGKVEDVNLKGLQYYNRLINSLIQRQIEPIVTLYHWDLPSILQQEYGGWLSEAVVDIFNEYARFCFQSFGDRVRFWITIYNPHLIAWNGYETGRHPPGESGNRAAMYTVGHNLIQAHAKAWHTYDTHFRKSQKGFVSLVLGSHWIEPKTASVSYEHFQTLMDQVLGWFAKPIFVDGDYPDSFKNEINSPTFTEKERNYIKGTADFFAFSFGPDNFRSLNHLVSLRHHASLHLGRVLNWIKLEYNDPRILIAENGWFSNSHVKTEDTTALYLMKKFVNEVLRAIRFNEVNVFGYTAWSLLDGFEWQYGYKIARGLFYVDFSSKEKSRIPKSSALFYKQIIEQNGFPLTEITQHVHGTFPCNFSWGIADTVLQVEMLPSSPQFIDHNLYMWNVTGNGALHKIKGTMIKPRPSQCTDFSSLKQHVALVRKLKVSHYSFALKWSQILPHGDLSTVNRDVLRYYRCVVSELLKLNIVSTIILYHPTYQDIDLPGPLLRNGGWLNRSTALAFNDYGNLCFQEFGNLVKFWITMNEPNINIQRSLDAYRAAHNMIIAHALTWHKYNKEYRHQYHGLVSLALRADWAEAANPYFGTHITAAERFLQFQIAWFADPIFKTGNYPVVMREYILHKYKEHLSSSSLPHFTDEEKQMIKGTADFFAINHFTTRLILHKPKNGSKYQTDHDGSLLRDATLLRFHSPSHSSFPFLSHPEMTIAPWGIRKVLNWIKSNYGNVDIYITANGVSDKSTLKDELRIYYHKNYINEVLKAQLFDQVNVKGYYAWKLKDTEIHVPLVGFFIVANSGLKPKTSVEFYNKLIRNNGFPSGDADNQCSTDRQIHCEWCILILKKKPLMFFGVCILFTAVMFAAIIIIHKRKRRKAFC
ncbi:beta-klotho [Callorhinchus milii]|uniref:beta-klotho n=1 Tax=Callorhinchus milii TaxID=7868 RepID=UPI001C3F753E|nr:beta-klotho [Callorhinchus milii]